MPIVEVFRGLDGRWYWRRLSDETVEQSTHGYDKRIMAISDAERRFPEHEIRVEDK